MHTESDTTGRATGRPPGQRGRPARLRRFWVLVLTAGMVSLIGCRSARNFGKPDCKYDLLVAELRTREQEVLEARAELQQLRMTTGTPGRAAPGLGCLPGEPAFHPGVPPGVRGISLAAGTGGVDDDGHPGDEAFMVVVVPRDDEGTAVKTPGVLRVSAYDVTPEGLKLPIGRWEVSPDQMRKAWRSGLLSTGYFVPLQWDQPPAGGKVRFVVRLSTTDGRDFEADKDVSVRPPVAAAPQGPAVGPPAPTAPVTPKIPPPEVPELPPPAGLKGTTTGQPMIELPPPAATLGGVKAVP
jgi:hypothetical protein